jgi:hypothetical protein
MMSATVARVSFGVELYLSKISIRWIHVRTRHVHDEDVNVVEMNTKSKPTTRSHILTLKILFSDSFEKRAKKTGIE